MNNLEPEEMDWEEDVDTEIQDIPNAHFDVLNSSLPGYGNTSQTTLMGSEGSSDSQEAAERAAQALLSAAPTYDRPLTKPKWHFGIRSRSPPMEVMLEIYKTLGALNMQWKKKEGIAMPEIGLPPPGGYSDEVDLAIDQWTAEHGGVAPQFGKRAPPKKEQSAQDKAAQALYLVETRAQYGDVVVRMDLQLYRVDGSNYLVDFRNIGYYRASSGKDVNPQDIKSVDLTDEINGELADRVGSVEGLGSTRSKETAAGLIGGVSGPFHFLEMACQLIAELANGA